MFSIDRQEEREYNKRYAKGVKPRYFKAYQKYPCVITSDKCQARLLQKRFKHTTTKKEGNFYIVTLQPKKIYPNVTY